MLYTELPAYSADRITVIGRSPRRLVEKWADAIKSMWLLVILTYAAVTFTLNLSWLIGLILKKLAELLKYTCNAGNLSVSISAPLEDAVKNTISTLKRLLTSAWKKDGDSRLDSTSAYSEMPGELDKFKKIQQEQLNKAMKVPIDPRCLRKSGL